MMMHRALLIASAAVTLLSSCTSVLRPPSQAVSQAKSKSSVELQKAVFKQAVNSKALVDYASLAESPAAINAAYADIARRSPDSNPEDFPTEESRFAYWMNAYNIATIYGVVEAYPIDSVRDVKPVSVFTLFAGGGFFVAQKYVFGGDSYSLYNLENKVIRERFSDPRLHFALNCASIGCPDLAPEPFTAANLERLLERQTRGFINSDKGVVIDLQAKEIRLSSIFNWYREDFEKDGVTLLDYVSGYYSDRSALAKARKDGYELAFLEYDWSLNKQ